MKFNVIFSLVLFLITYSLSSAADESNANYTNYSNYSNSNNTSSDLVINSSPVSQLLLTQELFSTPLDSSQLSELTPQVVGEFKSRFLSVEAGIIESKKNANWSKYYFQGAVILHQHNEFNVSLMANIEQINSFSYHHAQTPLLDNSIIINATEVNYSYGIMGSYSINDAWQFSGGIIHAQPLKETMLDTWYGDANMALIGTTYSF